MTFELVLLENGDITFQYSALDSSTPRALGSDATIGIETATGTDGIPFSYNEAVLANGLAIVFHGPQTDITPPTAPGSFTATATGPTSIGLSWTASFDTVGVAGYRIYRGGTLIASPPAGATSYPDTGLSASTPYQYSIVAYDAATNTSPASTASATTLADGAPSAPTNLAITSASATTLALSWTASIDDVAVTGYRVYQGATLIGSPTGTTFNAPKPSGSASFTVEALDGAGHVSPRSALLNWPAYDSTRPSAPTNLHVVSQARNKITLAWNAATDNLGGIANYRLYTSANKLVATLSGSTLQWTGNKSRNTTYYVVAVDIAGNVSLPSNTITPAALVITP
jgi:chitodextrinase